MPRSQTISHCWGVCQGSQFMSDAILPLKLVEWALHSHPSPYPESNPLHILTDDNVSPSHLLCKSENPTPGPPRS